MTGLNFDGIGPFQNGLTNERRGKLALRLTKACEIAPEARPAALALGSLSTLPSVQKPYPFSTPWVRSRDAKCSLGFRPCPPKRGTDRP